MGIFLAIISAFAFALSYIFLQKGMKKSEGDNGTFATIYINCILLLGLYVILLLLGIRELNFDSRGIFFFMLSGFFATFIGRMTLFSAFRRIGSSKAVAIKNAAPLFTVVFGVVIIGEQISLSGGIGIALILTALLIQGYRDYTTGKNDLQWKVKGIGLLLALFAAIGFGTGHAMRKQGVIFEPDPFLGALIGSLIALIAILVKEMLNKNLKNVMVNNFKTLNVYFILAGCITSVGQLAFFISVLYTNVSYTSVIASTESVLTIILARLFLTEEKVSLQLVTTALIILLGTVFIIVE